MHKQKLTACKTYILAYLHNVQHASAEDHQIDQAKFSYRFTYEEVYSLHLSLVFNCNLSIAFLYGTIKSFKAPFNSKLRQFVINSN